METNVFPRAASREIPDRTDDRTCGFTATTTMSQAPISSSTERAETTPNRRCRSSPRPGAASYTTTCSGECSFAESNPRIIASPMFPAPRNPSSMMSTPSLPASEDRGPDPDHRRPFADRLFEIVGHPHRQLPERRAGDFPRQGVPQFPQPREVRPAPLGVGGVRRDRHEPLHPYPGEPGGIVENRAQIAGGGPRLGPPAAEIDLDQDPCRPPGHRGTARDLAEPPGGIRRLDPGEQGDRPADLVPLQTADQVPFGSGEPPDLLLRLLDVILSEHRQPRRVRLEDPRERLGLRHRDQPHRTGLPPRPSGGVRDPVPHPRRPFADRRTIVRSRPRGAHRAPPAQAYQAGPLRATRISRARASIATTRVIGRPTTFENDPAIRSISSIPAPCAAYAPALSSHSPVW